MVKFFKKLRKEDETTRRRWLWLLTISFGLVVFLFWGAYLNLTVQGISYDTVTDKPVSNGFFYTFGAGLISVKQQAAEGLAILMREKSLDIKVPKHDFVYHDLAKTPPTPLP